MKVRDLLRRLWPFLLGFCAFFAVVTLVAPAAGDPTQGLGWVAGQFDLRLEGNIGAWYESVVFLVCAVSFAPLAAAGARRERVGRAWGLLFLVCALAFVFVALDEMTEIHERVGRKIEARTGFLRDTKISGHGFTWVLVYGPVAGLAFAGLAWGLGRLALRLPEGGGRRRALGGLIIALVSVPLVLACEVTEGYLKLTGSAASGDLLSCMEEVFEFGVCLGLIACNLTLSEGHDF